MRAPSGLGARARRLWDALAGELADRPADLVLLEEACRITDRLDALDRILQARPKALASVRFYETRPQDAVLVVDAALSEARQQASTLRQILTSLKQPAGGAARKGAGAVDDLTARRAARRAGASPS